MSDADEAASTHRPPTPRGFRHLRPPARDGTPTGQTAASPEGLRAESRARERWRSVGDGPAALGRPAGAAVGLGPADRRRAAEDVAVHNDRDRIARDLHDLVIQRLFATGMSLQSVVRLVDERPEEAIVRVNRAVDELDTAIRDLRSTIYGLRASVDEPPSLRSLLLTEIDAATAQLGFAPSLQLSGLLDAAVNPGVAGHLLAAAREALSNVARHAGASRVDVVVSVREGRLVLQIEDDGVGLDASTRRSGLANLGARAGELGGELVVTSVPQAGTSFTWQVLLPSVRPDGQVSM